MSFEIKNRWTGAVIWTGKAKDLRDAVLQAVSARADLADAYLARAYLAGAYLAGADLAGADLAGANLAGAYLADADLAGADLADAYLADADLAGAYLADADLAGADLARAYLADADLAGAYLADARNKPASLASHVDPKDPYVRGNVPATTRKERMLKYRDAHPDVPVVEQLDTKMLAAIEAGKLVLDMGAWHGPEGSCGTTHCRAGSAIHLAGKAGYALEQKLGSAERAGRAIYRASTGRAPWFFDNDAGALADIRRCAQEEAAEIGGAK